MSDNKRIAKNTLYLFIRTLLILGISLYTSRVVLQALGATDYGIYNVVGGVVAMLTFLNSAMVQASQRYMCIAEGCDDFDMKNRTFSTSLTIHALISIVVIIILETGGLWYVNNIMKIPTNRIFAVNVIYQFSIFIFFTRIIVVPYVALIVSHECFNLYAYISLVDYILQLVGVLFLKDFMGDKLILYVLILLIIASLHLFFYIIICKIKFKECVYHGIRDWGLFREMIKYSGWAFLGGFGFVARNQGVNLVINIFCNPAVNAARGIAYQVSTAVQTLVSSFQQAINPQIFKKYAKSEYKEMMNLIYFGSQISFIILSIIATPIIIRSEYILSLWLVDVPEYTSQFLIMVLLMCLVISLTGPLITAIQATGHIKWFQIIVSLIMCSDIPLSFMLLKNGLMPWKVTGVSILTSFLCLMTELLILKSNLNFKIKPYMINISKCIFVSFLVYIMLQFFSNNFSLSFIGLILLCVVDIILYAILSYFIILKRNERKIVTDYIHNKIK